MKKYIQRLITLTVGAAIFVGIPLYFHSWVLIVVSWIPALAAIEYLDQDI